MCDQTCFQVVVSMLCVIGIGAVGTILVEYVRYINRKLSEKEEQDGSED